jgi:hypothetical protein
MQAHFLKSQGTVKLTGVTAEIRALDEVVLGSFRERNVEKESY